MPGKNYTKFGKWYALVSLGFIAVSYNPVHLATNTTFYGTLLAIQSFNHRGLVGILLSSFIFILWVAVVVLGIVNERLWAKWLAILIYSLTTVIGLSEILIIFRDTMTYTTGLRWPAFILLNTLPKLFIPILGIVLILKKPKILEDR